MSADSIPAWTRVGELFGSELDTGVATSPKGDVPVVRIRVSAPIAQILILANLVPTVIADDSEHRTWLEFPYDAAFDEWLVQTVDVLAELRHVQPGYGQLELDLGSGADQR